MINTIDSVGCATTIRRSVIRAEEDERRVVEKIAQEEVEWTGDRSTQFGVLLAADPCSSGADLAGNGVASVG
ncbi:hypothetical protein K458DRAFT_411865 [Lentithecium fluviatile CBS 122367]|uniref:Uncharacterized protein n=1 Tax=Lentithecium fluviatile CBS 122367 TaxID=1168545 RepID=A0A6G1JPQ7_9PLEO|nr:hypothetical protein K458DRAFT_411865 [Lentithecium fluviatile CBS 122367]